MPGYWHIKLDPLLLKRFLNDIDKSYSRLRKLLNQMDDPVVSNYLKNQSQFTELISCIAFVRRNIMIGYIRSI